MQCSLALFFIYLSVPATAAAFITQRSQFHWESAWCTCFTWFTSRCNSYRSRLPFYDPGSVAASLLSALFQSIDAFVRVSLAKRKPCPNPAKNPFHQSLCTCSLFYIFFFCPVSCCWPHIIRFNLQHGTIQVRSQLLRCMPF